MSYTSSFANCAQYNFEISQACSWLCEKNNSTFRYNAFYTVGNNHNAFMQIVDWMETRHELDAFHLYVSRSVPNWCPEHVLPSRNRLIGFSMSWRFAPNFLFIQKREKLVFNSTKNCGYKRNAYAWKHLTI